ncbi:hypothetical protein RRG08_035643 [Elysia crispata]|uniref:HTH CENPB-type domain-containing protein n=1 Tax=Elysia crispata TaxID=231223 RepID=A0AAE0YAE3_9GAST|nr:hypothetical protein RRG08_035643 [Elysia crispata]
MIRNYKTKETGGRTSYTSSPAMIVAYYSVMSAQMSYQAAKHYDVDKKSLLPRVKNEIPIDAHPRRQSVLSPVQEQELAECLILLAEWSWGFSKEEVKDIIQEFLKDNDIQNPFTENCPGRDWFDAFLKRHREKLIT